MSTFGGGTPGHRSLLPVTPSLGDLLEARPRGLTEPETWALLYQAVQALQDLFLSDGASGIPLITPFTLLLSSKGRVRLSPSPYRRLTSPPPQLSAFLAPEYRPHRRCSDTDVEKMWIFGLGETLKRATMKSPSSSAVYCGQLYHVLSSMTMPQPASRASLMYLLDVISNYCKRRQQNRPFSHIVMDLHQEAMASLETTLYTWGTAPPAMPSLRPLRSTGNRSSEVQSSSSEPNTLSIPRRWMGMTRPHQQQQPLAVLDPHLKLTREASTSMEDLTALDYETIPALTQRRPKSMCLAGELDINHLMNVTASPHYNKFTLLKSLPGTEPTEDDGGKLCLNQQSTRSINRRDRLRGKRNPVQRAASRLYRAGSVSGERGPPTLDRDCVGPEFVVRATLPSKQITFDDCKGSLRKTVTVIMLNGQKIDISCNPNTVTAGQLFEVIIQKEHIEENFILGLSALIAGDFVFLPSDARICKAMCAGSNSAATATAAITLFLRVRFFLPSLRGVRGLQARHLIYLQLRRSVLEHQLPCSCSDLVELGGLALQAEFGDFSEKEHGTRDYFLLEHYVPETITCAVIDPSSLRKALTKAHVTRRGLDNEKSEEDFILLAQTLPHYGGHFYTAIWVMKDSVHKDIWLCISAQGINLYERGSSTPNGGPVVCESFEWRSIQTLCYSKHYLCILPHASKGNQTKLKKYKLKMDNKKSYFAFRLASLHHQFFLRLRTEFVSLQSLSQQFGIPLKDIKNESNCLHKLEADSQQSHSSTNQQKRLLDSNHRAQRRDDGDDYDGAVNAETEFKIDFRSSTRSSNRTANGHGGGAKGGRGAAAAAFCSQKLSKRSKSVNELQALNGGGGGAANLVARCLPLEEYQNKENENPVLAAAFGSRAAAKGQFALPPADFLATLCSASDPPDTRLTSTSAAGHGGGGGGGGGLVLDSSYLSGYPNANNIWDKRRGVKMGVSAYGNNGRRFSRSMEAVNFLGGNDEMLLDLCEMSLDSVSLNCSSNSICKLAQSPVPSDQYSAAYVLDSSIKSTTSDDQQQQQHQQQHAFLVPNPNESLSESLLDKLNSISFAEERLLRTVTVTRRGGSLGLQITEGSDGNVYVQSVVEGGAAADATHAISRGDQIVAVDGHNLLQCNYERALQILKSTGDTVAFVLAAACEPKATVELKSRAHIDLSDIKHAHLRTLNLETTLKRIRNGGGGGGEAERCEYLDMKGGGGGHEKHLTESSEKQPVVDYRKHIRYETESQAAPAVEYVDMTESGKFAAAAADIRKAVVVEVIPKQNLAAAATPLMEHVALPRSLGLGRKWRGPVRYPVTPVKQTFQSLQAKNATDTAAAAADATIAEDSHSVSDEEQVFI